MSKSETKRCAICGNTNSRKGKTQFCSTKCYLESNRSVKKCEVCKKEYSYISFYEKRTCSRKCGAKINASSQKDPKTWVTTKCNICNKDFDVRIKRLKRTKNVSCSAKCSAEFKSINFNHDWILNQNSGFFSSLKSGGEKKIRFDSSWELRRFKELEFDPKVILWDRCQDKILWYDSDNKKHCYNPDIYIEYEDGKRVVEEIKGFMNEEAKLKIEAGEEFYDRTEILFRVIDNKNILFDKKLEYKTEEYENDYGIFNRLKMEYIWMSLAIMLASKSTCSRLKVGSVITDSGMNRALCVGYNGDEKGGKNQCESLKPGKCGCLHAETNAIAKSRESLENCILFVTTAPCKSCVKLIINSGIREVIYNEVYRDTSGLELMKQRGLKVTRFGKIEDDTLL